MEPRRSAPATWVLLGLCLLVQLVLSLADSFLDVSRNEISTTLSLVPKYFWEGRQPWALLSWLFIHDSWLQFFFAALTLSTLGAALERELGSVRYAWVYLVSGVFSALPLLFLSNAPYTATGTSFGAICGLLGTLTVCYPRTKLLVLIIPIPVWLLTPGLLLLSTMAYAFNDYDLTYLLIYPTGLLAGIGYALLALKLRPGSRFARDMQVLAMQGGNPASQGSSSRSAPGATGTVGPVAAPGDTIATSQTNEGSGSSARVDPAQYLKAMQQSGGISGKLESSSRSPGGQDGKIARPGSGPVSMKGRMSAPQKPQPLVFPDQEPPAGNTPPASSPGAPPSNPTAKTTDSPDTSSGTGKQESSGESAQSGDEKKATQGKKLIYNPQTGQFEYKD